MKKLLLAGIFILITLLSFSAEVIRYVDTDATGTGTGLDWTNAYTSLFDWEAAENTDLVTAGDWHHVWVRASSGTADTTAVVIDGWTTGASNYILIEAAIGDEALKSGWDITRYRLSVTDTRGILINENYVRVNGLQLKATYVGTDFLSVIDTSSWAISASNDLRISNCYITVSGGTYKGVYNHDADAIMTVYNTIIYNYTGNGMLNVGTLYLYNSIVYGDNTDIGVNTDVTATIKNSAIFNNTDDIDNSGTAAIDYSASDDGDGTNPVSPFGSDWTNEFSDPANGDFTLLNTGNLYHGGASDPDVTLYTTDIEGDAYNSAAYSIGVDEYVSAGGIINPVISSDGIHSLIFGGQILTGMLFLWNIMLTISICYLFHRINKKIIYDPDLIQAQKELEDFLNGGR